MIYFHKQIESVFQDYHQIPIYHIEICSNNQSDEFCECTAETILDNYSREDLVNLRTSLSGGELPSDIFQLGIMNCAIYLGQ